MVSWHKGGKGGGIWSSLGGECLLREGFGRICYAITDKFLRNEDVCSWAGSRGEMEGTGRQVV